MKKLQLTITCICTCLALKAQITEAIIGVTTYDLQTNASMQKRIMNNGNGTISAVWTYSESYNIAAADRGTGYNYFNGTSWGAVPTSRIELQKTGWPNIASASSGDEVFLCHNTTASTLTLGKRPTIGSGAWTLSNVTNPLTVQVWSRMTIGGSNGQSIHHISMNDPFGVPNPNGVQSQMFYYRSQDTGATWDITEYIIPGVDSSRFTFMSGDSYTMAVARGNTIAFAYFGKMSDVILVKSLDNGTTWTVTPIIDLFPGNVKYDPDATATTGNKIGISDINNDGVADSILSSDGTGYVLIDQQGMAHVVFGQMQHLDDVAGDGSWSYFPGWNGLMYWNENYGANAPIIIAGAQDLDGDSTLNSIVGIANYGSSISSHPSMGISSNGCIYVSYSAVMETLNQGTQNYRHIYITRSCDGGCSWTTPVDVTPGTGFEENIFASMADNVDSNIHLVYQRDYEPGMAVQGDLDSYVPNDIVYLKVPVSVISASPIGFVCPFTITATISSTVNIICSGECNGSATVTVNLGTPPFTYLWNDPMTQTTATVVNLCAGSYIITVVDSAGDTATAGATITAPAPLSLITSSTGTCGTGTGTASVSVSGGTGAYTYLWDPAAAGQTNAAATGLAIGTYSVTVTDNNGCADSASATVPATPGVSFTISSTNPTICTGSNGSATLSVSSGTPPYSYLWSTSPSQTGITATGLASGTYSVSVTDGNGCTASSTTNLVDPGSPLLTISNFTMVTCSGGNNGSATVNASGATQPYSYLWNTLPQQTDSTATGLSAGTYSVTVTDAGLCASAIAVLITEPSALITTMSITDVSCNGASDGSVNMSVSGGSGPSTFLWSNSSGTEDIDSLFAGLYTVTVTDSAGCTVLDSANINEPAAIVATIAKTDVICAGDSSGSATLTANGGIAPYTYLWNSGASTNVINGISAGNYTITVTDSTGCIATDSIVVNEISQGPQTGSITGAISVIEFETKVYSVPFNAGSTYFWMITGGNQLGGGQTNSITVQWGTAGTGQISVVETDSFGCIGDTATLQILIGTSGVDESRFESNAIEIFPNPNNGEFIVRFKKFLCRSCRLEIINLIGQVVFLNEIENPSDDDVRLILGSNFKGMYFLRISNKSASDTHKLLVY